MTSMMIVSKDLALTCENRDSFDDGREEAPLEYHHVLNRRFESGAGKGLEFIHSVRHCLWHVQANNRFLFQSMRSNWANSISYFGVDICDLA